MSDVSDEEVEVGVVIAVKDAILKPFHNAASKKAQRAYLNTLLLALTSSVLLVTAVVAYLLFYFSYVPDRGFSRPIYLQFESNHPPYGSASIKGALVSFQPYDVKVVLHMPQTPSNKAAGNFMIDVQLLAPGAGTLPEAVLDDKSNVLGQASRSAILRYHSTTMEHVMRVAALPLHLTGWCEEAESLNIKMIEGIEFPKGWRNIPETVRIELRSNGKLQVYDARVEFTARLRGLRYMMYNFRALSFLVLTGLFWLVEMSFAGVVWLSLASYLSSESTPETAVKIESGTTGKQRIKGEDELSDTPHTFPTLSGQPPLRYASPRVKEEEVDVPVEAPTMFAEADDEDEDDDFVRDDLGGPGRGVSDSGLGTSMDSSAGRSDSIRRRKSRTGND